MGFKSRSVVAITVLAFTLITSSILYAQVPADPNGWWSTYHKDGFRSGVNDLEQFIDGNSIGLVFTFPRWDNVDPNTVLVDNVTTAHFELEPKSAEWKTPTDWGSSAPTGFWNSGAGAGFFWDEAKQSATGTATWSFPYNALTMPAGPYTVQIWLPYQSDPDALGYKKPSAVAQYTIVSGNNKYSYTINQNQDSGGQWITLAEVYLQKDAYVKLSNQTTDYEDNVVVLADAVRFVPVLGTEIYTSPAAGSAKVGLAGESIPAFWIGTIETAQASLAPGIVDFGAMYCVRSYQGVGLDPSDPNQRFNWRRAEVTNLGTAAWRYPSAGRYDSRKIKDAKTLDRDPLEGPITRLPLLDPQSNERTSGIYSSPTLVTIGSNTYVVFGAEDGQVYCLNADTGKLKWKGPGVTISENNPDDKIWTELSGRYDAFGGKFLYANCITGKPEDDKASILYDIDSTVSDPGTDANKAGDGHYYSIYVWMPAVGSSEPKRSGDAAYGVTYYDAETSAPKTEWITIDERDTSETIGDENGPFTGRWIQLGDKFWNPESVELSRVSEIGDTSRVVVADAIMVVPCEINRFAYSTAVPDKANSTTKIYIGNNNGRVYALNADNTGSDCATHMAWVYPQVQKQNPQNGRLPDPFGAIPASPAVEPSSGDVIVASLDGKVYRIKSDGSDCAWTFDATAASKGSTSVGAEQFNSSPAISPDGKTIYVPSIGGRMYALAVDGKTSSGATTADCKWIAPDPTPGSDPSTEPGELPLGGFKFSTPAVTTDRVYCGSTDGFIYAFDAAAGTVLDSTNGSYTPPQVGAPIQGSVALDANNMYVGTMGTGNGEDGSMYWFNRLSGATASNAGLAWYDPGYSDLGMLFSSPAVANDYVYVGSQKGRVYAFSSRNWGGNFVGGGPEGYKHPPFPRVKNRTAFATNGNQADVFSSLVYNESLKALKSYDPATLATTELGDALSAAGTNAMVNAGFTGVTGTKSDQDNAHKRAFPYSSANTSSSGDRVIYYEWGESVYLMAWNLPALAELDGGSNAITFRFNNVGVGRNAGGTIGSVNPDADKVFEYEGQWLEEDPNDPTKFVTKTGKRCIAFARLDIRADSSVSQPPAPGCGWNVSVRVRRQLTSTDPNTGNTTTTRATDPLIYVPKLASGVPSNPRVSQEIGINNPLAIRAKDASGTLVGLGWPSAGLADGTWPPNRNVSSTVSDKAVHCNGNTYLDGTVWGTVLPVLYAGKARHGANSPKAYLEVMDRGAVGLTTTAGQPNYLKCFRLQTDDCHWQGGNGAVINPLPWDDLPFMTSGTYTYRSQKDYPDIAKKQERFQKLPDATDPAESANNLQGAIPYNSAPDDYDQCRLRSEAMDTWIEVPLYQPANLGVSGGPGYRASLTAYLDTNGNGRFDSGTIAAGRPTTYIEANRCFDLAVDVTPDFHMVVETPKTIELKGPDGSTAPHGLNLFLDPADPTTKDWWKQFTVRNLGNVNLYNMKIAKQLEEANNRSWPLNLYAQDVSPNFPILGTNPLSKGITTGIVSSFDGWDPRWGDVSGEPFATKGLGYTLSKPRVGEINGTVLTIPDSRKCQVWPGVTATEIQKVDPAWFAKYGNAGIQPSVSLVVPLTQPSGSYQQIIPVFSDLVGNDNSLNVYKEPFCDPTFKMLVTIGEDRLTGGATSGAAPQIDRPENASSPFGDTLPAAYRDRISGSTNMIFSTNRFGDPASPNKPWYLTISSLMHNGIKGGNKDIYDWLPADPTLKKERWWTPSAPQIPTFKWPEDPNTNKLPAGLILDSIKHSSPFIAINETLADGKGDRAWCVWQGQAQKYNASNGRIETENRVFYTLASKFFAPTSGNGGGGGSNMVYSFGHDLSLMRMNPKAIVYNTSDHEVMWIFWSGGDAGRTSIYGNVNISKAATAFDDDSNHDATWSGDVRFPTPNCLSSVADPCPIQRVINNNGSYVDLVYTGTSKYDGSSDIMLTRYACEVDQNGPKITAIPMPRVKMEELLRDAKLNVYTSKHLAWVRPPADGAASADAPMIRFVHDFNRAFTATSTNIQATATDMVTGIKPEVDRATGIYTYKYPDGGYVDTTCGQMIVDYSAGIIRFTKPLPAETKVVVDYTPQAVRLTHVGKDKSNVDKTNEDDLLIGKADVATKRQIQPSQDGSPYAFIEKLAMTRPLGKANNAKVMDRMWLFWKKSSVQTSAIWYRTYRLGITLANPIDLSQLSSVKIDGALGPVELSADGRRLYFTTDDERYPGIPGNTPIDVTYHPANKPSDTNTEGFYTISWIEELPETMLPTRLKVNEGQVCAFADPCSSDTRIFVFWASTRAGESDLYYETISPNFTGK